MGTYNAYTKEQEQFIVENFYGISRKELTERFNKKFNTNKSVLAIKSWCNNRGLNCGNDGRFKDGNVSWQTGLSKEEYKSHFTKESYKRSIKPIIDKRVYEIGDTILRHGEPYVIISTDENVVLDKRIQTKRRYIYEKAYGKIPPKHRIIHLDGDKSNLELDNLYCIPSKYIPTINKNHWLTDSRDHTLTAIKWCELYYAIKK